ncbi:hypothetical protein [Luteolibacter soli]|uniref:Yip1 domain-containing protein n=1 Tax=Luteolibacter soli TaxID=3135280 RepID=A0ABU9AXY0_9BACT
MNPSLPHNPFKSLLTLCSRVNASAPWCKGTIIAGGYATGLVIAAIAVLCNYALHGWYRDIDCAGPEIIGNALVFMAVFILATIPSACGGFYFLRPARTFWNLFSPVCLLYSLTGLAAAILTVTAPASPAGAIGFLRIALTPIGGIGFFIAGIFAPTMPHRIALLTATALEALTLIGWILAPFLLRIA